MFCCQCGKEIPNESSFCCHCGAPVAVDSVSSSPCAPAYTPPQQSAVTAPNGKTIDLEKAYSIHGKDKMGFTSYLCATYGISYKEAKAMCSSFLEEHQGEDGPSFFERMKNQAAEANNPENMSPVKRRIKENKERGIACCPKCGSTSLSANKKGFGIGKAVVGAAITGPLGLVAGNIKAKKLYVTCLNCGNRWKM